MKPLTERMENRTGTPKSWIAEVKKLITIIKEKDKKIAEYVDIIDVLARKVEAIEEKGKDLDWEAQELLKQIDKDQKEFGPHAGQKELARASALHYAIDKIREVME